MTTLVQVAAGTGAIPDINSNFLAVSQAGLFGRKDLTTSGLTFGYYGGFWAGFTVSDGTVALTASATNYVVVAIASGAVSVSTATTDWDDSTNFVKLHKITTDAGAITVREDHRPIYGVSSGGGGGSSGKVVQVACSDETTALSIGSAKVTFRMPYAMTLTAVRASLTTAQTSGSIFTVDINEAGASILSTKLTVDNTEKTSTTAAAAAVISDTSLADDAEITIDIDQIGDGTATGLKVTLIGT